MEEKTQNKSFTLIEMLVVVVIIGILAGVLVPRLVGAKERASDSARLVKVGQLNTAVETYAQDNGGVYPIAPLTTTGTSIATPFVSSAIGSYLTTIPTDPGKGTVAILGASGNIQVTGDSFAYYTNTGGTMYAITALMESKKGNTTNGIGVIDSDKQGGYQVVGKGLAYSYALGGKAQIGVTQNGTDLIISDGTNTYVIQDRNVGASVVGTGPASYGWHFQWGNNYGFSTDPVDTITTSAALINASAYGPNNPYKVGIFNTYPSYYWDGRNNTDLRGHTTNTNVARRGPCDEGYHVPTQAERQSLYNTWKNAYSGNISYISAKGYLWMNTLLLPLAGYRSRGDAVLKSQGVLGMYWSTTPNGMETKSCGFFSTSVNTDSTTQRNNADSVRCFKN